MSFSGISEATRAAFAASAALQNAYARTFQKYSSGADSNSPLNVPQQAHAIGDPVPIAFGRRRDNAGGMLISPRVTECRFENDVNNAVTAYYHLVLSEGQIGSIQVRDVFQRQCRVGGFQQTYNRRAGSWVPENAIVQRVGYTKPEASNFCGSPGTYEGISTMSFEVTVPNGLDVWNRQVHAFIRNGIQVYRWADLQANVASDSFADLAYWLMQNSARIPLSLIDTESIRRASQFLDANNITTNCWLTKPINYDELISTWGRYHLLRPVNVRGKVGLKPLLQLDNDFTIKTSPITIDYTFNDDTIISESVSIDYLDWASRQPFVCQIIWRQQLDADTGVIRTAEVRYDGTAADGPYESHDLSEFCTREDHAVKVGAYILARRVRSNHLIRFRVRPGLHSSTVSQGSIIRVRLQRTSDLVPSTVHDRVYEVERVQRSLTGEVAYEATHVPVDDQLRSLVALDVANAEVSGVLFSSISTGDGCDINSSSDTTVPTDDPADTILPGPEDPAIGGGTFPPLPQADFPVFAPEASGVVETAEFNRFVDEQTDARFIEIIDDLLDDTATALRDLSDAQVAGLLLDLTGPDLQSLIGNLTAAQLRALTNVTLEDLIAALTPAQIRALSDSQLEELFDGFSAAQIRAFSDEVLEVLVDALVAQQIRSFSDGLLEAIGDALTAAQIRSFSDGLLEQLTDALAAAQVRSFSDGFLEAAADALTAAQVRSLSDGFLESTIDVLTAAQIRLLSDGLLEAAADALTAAQVRSLSDGLLEVLFAGLTAAQVRSLSDGLLESMIDALTVAQVLSLSDGLLEAVTDALTAAQVRSLGDDLLEAFTDVLTVTQIRSLSDGLLEAAADALTAAQVRSFSDGFLEAAADALTAAQVRSLSDGLLEVLFAGLTAAQVRALTDQEIEDNMAALTAEEIRALSDAQVKELIAVLTASQIRSLSDAQLEELTAVLTAAQIRSFADLQVQEFAFNLTADQIRVFTGEQPKSIMDIFIAAQVRALTNSQILEISGSQTAEQIRSFADLQVEEINEALTASQIRLFTDAQVEEINEALTASQIRLFTDAQVEEINEALTASQIRSLPDPQVEEITEELTAAQIRTFEDSQVEEITESLTASQIRSLPDSQVEEITEELTAAQVRSLSDSQVEEITSELTAAEIRSLDDANSVEFIEAATVEQIRALPDAQIEELVDELTDSQIRALSDDELNQLFNDLTPEQIRALPDADLAGLFDDLTADQIRALPDADLADVADNAADEALVTLLDEPVRDVVKEQLDLDFTPELVSDLQLKFKDAELLEDFTAQPDPLGDYETGLYFHSATWDANVLTVRMRLSPTGKAPRQDLGALQAAIASTSVVALLPDGRRVIPQPASLPSLSFSGQIAAPWNAATEGLPIPPGDRVFEGVFVFPFSESDFPPAAENPAHQLTYRATVEFTGWNGGFTDVAFLNTLKVDFEATVINLTRISKSNFTGSSEFIGFDEFPLGTVNPVYSPADYGGTASDPTVSFAGRYPNLGTSIITGDFAQPATPVIAGSTQLEGPISVFFNKPVAGVGCDVGFLDAIGSVQMVLYGESGQPIGGASSSSKGIEFIGFATSNGAEVITGIEIFTLKNEPYGFSIDSLYFAFAGEVTLP